MPSCAARRNSAVTELRNVSVPRQVLMKDLPHKTEFVLVIKTTPLQRRLYKAFIERRRKEVARLRLLRRPTRTVADHSLCTASVRASSLQWQAPAGPTTRPMCMHAPRRTAPHRRTRKLYLAVLRRLALRSHRHRPSSAVV